MQYIPRSENGRDDSKHPLQNENYVIKGAQCITIYIVDRNPTGVSGQNALEEGQCNSTGWKDNNDRHYQAQLK